MKSDNYVTKVLLKDAEEKNEKLKQNWPRKDKGTASSIKAMLCI